MCCSVLSEAVELALAIDVGGTKLAAAVVDAAGKVVRSQHRPTQADRVDGEALFSSLVELVAEVRQDSTVGVVGVGCGGPMAAGGEEVSPLNIRAWRRFPLRRRLAEATDLPVFVDNDAKALARGEGWVGAAAGAEGFIAMVVSTGVGGGIVLDGRLLHGGDGNAGHIGHVVVEPAGHRCVCGGVGCLEAEASGTAITAITGRPPAEADGATRQRTGRLVGRGVASVCNLLDLRLVTVAGSVALGFGAPFFAAAQAEMDLRCRLEFSRGAVIIPSALGAEGPLLGAAAVARRGLHGLPDVPSGQVSR